MAELSDGVLITVSMIFKDGEADAFLARMPDFLKDTETHKGFRSIRIDRHEANPNRVLFIQVWDTAADYNDYVAWRTKEGDFDEYARLLTEPPVFDTWNGAVLQLARS